MMRILTIFFLSWLLSGCATEKVKLDAFYAHRPRSIVVVPVLNESPEVSAPSVFITTISRPLAERGYYVFPVYLTDMILRDFGLTEAGHIHQLPPSRFYELFGADAVLFVTIKDWSTKYLVLASSVDVRMEYVLKDTKTGIELWRNEQIYSHRSGGSEAGLVGMAISAAIDALVVDYMPLARAANNTVLMQPRGLPPGVYSPSYQSTGNDGVTLKKLPSSEKNQTALPTTLPQPVQPPTPYSPPTQIQTTQPVVEQTEPTYQTYQQPQAHTSGKDLRYCLALVDNNAIAECVRKANKR